MDIAKRLLDLCIVYKMTPSKMADVSDVPRSTIQDIISHRNKNPRINTIEKICKGLKISLPEFFAEDKLITSDLPIEAIMEIQDFEKYIRFKYQNKR